MSLTLPSALWWATLAVPVIALYVLKVRFRRVPVSTVMFWERVFEDTRPRTLLQRLRHVLSLLMQLLVLLLLVGGLAQPVLDSEIADARRIVLIVDTSASMRAAHGGRTRLDAAREAARDLIGGLRFHDTLALVSAGTEPRVHCGLTGHRRTLRRVLSAVAGTDGPTRVDEAVALARRLLARESAGEIVVLTDGCFETAPELEQAADVRLVKLGDGADNVGITRFQVRRSTVDALGYEVLAEVVNHSLKGVACRLELELDGRLVDVVPLELAPGARWSQVFEKTSVGGGRLVARLDRGGALAADDGARAILPRRRPRPVTLVTPGSLFLAKVLEAHALVDLSVTAGPAGPPRPGALTVLHGSTPEEIPPGDVFVIEVTGSTDLWEAGDPLQNAVVGHEDRDARLMAHVQLENVLLPRARHLRITSPHDVLVASLEDVPLLFSVERPEGRVLVLNVDLDAGDLPLRTAFPILFTNALSWFAREEGELREALATGAVARVRASPGLAARARAASGDGAPLLALEDPAGRGRTLPLGPDDHVTVGPLDATGVWTLRLPGGEGGDGPADAPHDELAVNLADPGESALRPPDGLAGEPPPETAGLGGRPLWFHLVLLALAFSALEWCLYQRRRIS